MTAPLAEARNSAPTREPTRILFIIYGLQPAGPELRLLEFARHFPPACEVHVCVIGDDLTMLEEFRRTPARMCIIPVRRPWTEWRQIRRILRYIRTHRIDIVNTFDLKTLLVGVAAKLRFGRRIRLAHHLISLWDGLHEGHKRAIRQGMRLADVVVCNGRAVRDGLIGERRMRARVCVVPNGVDCERFRPAPELRRRERARAAFADTDFVFGTIANVRPVKNFELLLATMQRLLQRYPHVRLVCVGGGSHLEQIHALATELGIAERVLFTGQSTDIVPWIATFDAFVLTSWKEGCPNALMQAMAMALPSASSAVGEVPYLTDGGRCGLMFDPADADACFSALSRLVEDAPLRAQLARDARARMEQHYSNPRMIADYVTLFETAAAGVRR